MAGIAAFYVLAVAILAGGIACGRTLIRGGGMAWAIIQFLATAALVMAVTSVVVVVAIHKGW